MRHASMTICTLAAAVFAPLARAESGGDTQVTTYVIKVQEQREQTRWTLTEWLRIKERMKMMDVWLAMFSDPKKDKFQPELMLSYGITRSNYSYDDAAGRVEDGALSGTSARGQLWLTNLVSSTIGVRTLNIDLGGEYYRRQSAEFTSAGYAAGASVQAATAASGTAASPPGGRGMQTDYYTGNLRIFGRNVQDSSLVLKYGNYQARNEIVDPVATNPVNGRVTGRVAGAELQLYLFRWLGAEGNYMQFGDSRGAAGTPTLSGTYYDYLAYVEISLFRIMGGVYTEEWDLTRQSLELHTRETGTIGGVKLQF